MHGWQVGALDLDRDAAHRTAAGIGPDACALHADITDEAAVEAALDDLAARTGSPAPLGVVCNAGIARFDPLLELGLGGWEAVTRST
ncbi:MAG: SDR family oxidoreductase [Microthrixaceae bacterium]